MEKMRKNIWLMIFLALSLGFVAGDRARFYVLTRAPHSDFPEAVKDAQFVKFTDEIIRLEGGFVLSDSGATYAGISRGAHPDSPFVENGFIPNIYTCPRLKFIVSTCRDYYKRLHIHDLPQAISFLIYDFGINAGTYTSARTIQNLVFTDPRQVDGHIGPFTIAAIDNAIGDLSHDFSFARMSYYVRLVAQNPEKYGGEIDGWEDRTKKALKFSQQLK